MGRAFNLRSDNKRHVGNFQSFIRHEIPPLKSEFLELKSFLTRPAIRIEFSLCLANGVSKSLYDFPNIALIVLVRTTIGQVANFANSCKGGLHPTFG
jgi:hypothetical protein